MITELMKASISIPDSGFSPIEISRRRDGRHVRLSNGRRNRAVGRYASVKMGTTIPWESRLELSDIYRAEVNPEVSSYMVQPETLRWQFGRVSHQYTPDRVDVFEDGNSRIVEVKDEFDAARNEMYTEKLKQVAQIYNCLGQHFELRERSNIRREPDYSAVEEVQAYRRAVVSIQDLREVYAALRNGPISLGDAARLFSHRSGRPVLFAMMVRRIISIDLTQGLREDALVSPLQKLKQ